MLEAIKLYNLAGDYQTVITCLAQALGNTIAQPNAGGEKGKAVEHTAAEIVRHYERTNRAVGRARDAVVRLLRIREAMSVKADGRVDVALDVSGSLGGEAGRALTCADPGVDGPDTAGRRRREDHAAHGGVQGHARGAAA